VSRRYLLCARLQARDTSERVSRANVRRCVPEIRRNALYTTVLSERARCSLAQNENYSYTYSRLFVHTMAVFFSSWTWRRRPAVAAAGGRHVAVASSRASKTRGRLRRAHDTQRDRRYHSLLHSVLLHVHDFRARAASARQIRRFLPHHRQTSSGPVAPPEALLTTTVVDGPAPPPPPYNAAASCALFDTRDALAPFANIALAATHRSPTPTASKIVRSRSTSYGGGAAPPMLQRTTASERPMRGYFFVAR